MRVRNVVIVEDETHAAKHLEGQLTRKDLTVLASLDSVKNAAKWFANNPMPDLIIMDVQLGDGLSFEIFEIVKIECPVIFLTAFDQYAIEAFKLNSIAYLLKPVDDDELNQALGKYETMQQLFTSEGLKEQINSVRNQLTNSYKTRFILKVGEHLKSIPVEDIVFFYSADKATFIRTNDARSRVVDMTLDQIQEKVNPEEFFRINRKYLVSYSAIEDIVTYRNSRLLLKLKYQIDSDAIVSREKVNDFKQWLDR